MKEIVIGYAICLIGFILCVVLLFNTICRACSANERTLTSRSDVETFPAGSIASQQRKNPNTTPSHGVTLQIAEDEVNEIQEEHLDDTNNSAFPVTTSFRNGPCNEPFSEYYAGKTNNVIDLHFII